MTPKTRGMTCTTRASPRTEVTKADRARETTREIKVQLDATYCLTQTRRRQAQSKAAKKASLTRETPIIIHGERQGYTMISVLA